MANAALYWMPCGPKCGPCSPPPPPPCACTDAPATMHGSIPWPPYNNAAVVLSPDSSFIVSWAVDYTYGVSEGTGDAPPIVATPTFTYSGTGIPPAADAAFAGPVPYWVSDTWTCPGHYTNGGANIGQVPSYGVLYCDKLGSMRLYFVTSFGGYTKGYGGNGSAPSEAPSSVVRCSPFSLAIANNGDPNLNRFSS